MKQPLLLAVFLTVAVIIPFYPGPEFINGLYDFDFLLTFSILALIFLQMSKTISLKRGVIFYALAVFIAFCAEVKGLNFDHKYTYAPSNFEIFGVPLSVIVWWGIFIYICYSFTNTFLVWVGGKKPSIFNKGSFKFIPLLVILDAVFMSSVNLVVDPLAVYLGKWSWFAGGAYFGVPLSDFRGLFLVAGLSCLIFRVFEYFFPFSVKLNISAQLTVVFLFALFNLNFARIAAGYGLTGVALVGIYVTLPPVFVNLLLFQLRMRKK